MGRCRLDDYQRCCRIGDVGTKGLNTSRARKPRGLGHSRLLSVNARSSGSLRSNALRPVRPGRLFSVNARSSRTLRRDALRPVRPGYRSQLKVAATRYPSAFTAGLFNEHRPLARSVSRAPNTAAYGLKPGSPELEPSSPQALVALEQIFLKAKHDSCRASALEPAVLKRSAHPRHLSQSIKCCAMTQPNSSRTYQRAYN